MNLLKEGRIGGNMYYLTLIFRRGKRSLPVLVTEDLARQMTSFKCLAGYILRPADLDITKRRGAWPKY